MDAIDLTGLQACVAARWSPGLGDPSVMGWVTVAAYALAALACLVAARVRHRDRAFWVLLTILMAALCVNKQLDLQSALTATGRCIAKAQGWYGQRRMVQLVFVVVLLGLGVSFLAGLLFVLRRRLSRIGVAILGLGLLVTFVAMRAVGFHHFDQMIGLRIGGARVNWLLELTGIALIAANAIAAWTGRRRPRAPARAGTQADP